MGVVRFLNCNPATAGLRSERQNGILSLKFKGDWERFFRLLLPFRGGWEGFFIFSSLLREVGRGFKIALKNIFIFILNLPSPLLKEGEFFFFFLLSFLTPSF